MAFQSSKTLFELINFLTRPLMKAYPSVTVLFHRQILQKQLLATFFKTSAPFTLFLSPYSLPPMPIYTACLMSGIKWADWARLLAPEGQGIVVFVLEGKIQIRSPSGSELTTVWSESSNIPHSQPQAKEASPSSSRPSLSSLSRALDSVRSRSTTTTAKSPSKALTKPLTTAAIRPVVSRPRTPFQRKPTPLSQVIMISDDEDEEDECDSDSESDAGSDISSASSLFSATSSSGSVTSVASSACSSPCTSPAQSKPSLDLIRASITTKIMPTTTTKPKVSPITIPARRAPAPTSTVSRSDLRLVDRTKTDVTRYNYKGGQTAVMTGGVMLGAARSKGACSPSSANKASKKSGSAGASQNWRRA
ncbi:hypothetical protein PQX77_004293 [Marasmius sp. AFHP31]|nr:hypothetical protein PQX77_004293 [Marasmius sp. AFHP31]